MRLLRIFILLVMLPKFLLSQMIDETTPTDALPANTAISGVWKLDFSDEFNGTEVNSSKWIIDNSTKSRAARPNIGIFDWRWKTENVSVENGKLVLKVYKSDEHSMTNGSVNSRSKYLAKYGYFEARIKIGDATKGTHTAFWLQGPNMGNVDGTANDGAEIDIFESAWTGEYTKSVVHIDGYGASHKANTKKYTTPDIHSGFHTWGFHWTEDFMDIYYDGEFKVRYADAKWIVKSLEYLWLSNGASFGLTGDQYFVDRPVGFLTQTEVDYVRVWKDEGDKKNDSLLNKSGWSLIKTDSEDIYGNNLAKHAFDNNPLTFWHTEWKNMQPEHPHEIQIDLGDTANIFGLHYLPRQDGNVNGNISGFEFYASNDSLNWGEPINSGTFLNESKEQKIRFSDTVKCTFVRLVALSEINGKVFSSVGELDLVGNYIVDIPVGIEKRINESSTVVFPNPFSNEINIKPAVTCRYSSWRIYSNDGRVVSHGELLLQQHAFSVNTSMLKSGTYILELSNKKGREAWLIVKK